MELFVIAEIDEEWKKPKAFWDGTGTGQSEGFQDDLNRAITFPNQVEARNSLIVVQGVNLDLEIQVIKVWQVLSLNPPSDSVAAV
jgi:hypothetical protein